MTRVNNAPDGDDPMAQEFSTAPQWTAEAVDTLGADHAVPAGCRGSGSPDALRWLARETGLAPGVRLLDSGAGEGGPAELAAREFGAVPLLVDPMPGAAAAARRMFGRPSVVADGAALPVPDAAFDVAWSLGVLCTVEDKAAQLAELRRAIGPGGRIGLLVFVRTGPLTEQPEGNHFPDRLELTALLDEAGLDVVAEAALADFAESSARWQRLVDEVNDLVAQRHGDEEAFRSVRDQQRTIGGLLADGSLVGSLVVARPRVT